MYFFFFLKKAIYNMVRGCWHIKALTKLIMVIQRCYSMYKSKLGPGKCEISNLLLNRIDIGKETMFFLQFSNLKKSTFWALYRSRVQGWLLKNWHCLVALMFIINNILVETSVFRKHLYAIDPKKYFLFQCVKREPMIWIFK